MEPNKVIQSLNKYYDGALYEKLTSSKDRYNTLKNYREDFDSRAILVDILSGTKSIPKMESPDGNSLFYKVDEKKIRSESRTPANYRMKLDVQDLVLSEDIVPIGVQNLTAVIMTVMFNNKFPNYSLDLPLEELAKEYQSTLNSVIATKGSQMPAVGTNEFMMFMQDAEEEVLRTVANKRFDNIKAANLLHEFETRTLTNAIKQQISKNFIQFANLIFWYPKDVKTEREAIAKSKVIPFYRYTLLADNNGEIVECVIKEFVNKYSITPDEVEWYNSNNTNGDFNTNDFEVYTHIRFFGELDKRKYELVKEYNGIEIKDSYESGNEEDCPYIIYSNPDALDIWGSMYLEPYFNTITKACAADFNLSVIGEIAALGTILMDKNAIAEGVAESFRELTGKIHPVNNIQDVVAKLLSFEVANNYNALANNKVSYTQTLKEAMMLMSAVQQNKDRQTAEEVIRVSDEISKRQGASYTTFEDFRGKIAERSKQRAIAIGNLPKSAKNLQLTMGLDRPNSEEYVNRLLLRLQNLNEVIGQLDKIILNSLNIGVIANMVLSSSGFNPSLFFDSDKLITGISSAIREQSQMEEQQRMQQAIQNIPQGN